MYFIASVEEMQIFIIIFYEQVMREGKTKHTINIGKGWNSLVN